MIGKKKLILGILIVSIFFLLALFISKEIKKETKKLERIDDLVIIYDLDKKIILEKINQGKDYLLRIIDEKEKGAYKYYYPQDDIFEDRLYTIYTSSSLFSLLKFYEWRKDDVIFEKILKSAEFILSMQNKEKDIQKDRENRAFGAFYYSYFLNTKERENYYVVGTTSKTIFTLLELYKFTKEEKYLESAKKATDWLLTMQNKEGKMSSYLKYTEGKWFSSNKYSLLYNGQSLSAFSRMYTITGEKKYFEAGEKIAKNFVDLIKIKGCLVGDDYREKNPISSSWIIRSLLDFYRIKPQENYREIVLTCSDDLIKRQINDEFNVIDNGSWKGVYSTSGVGWLAEVMSEVYYFCHEQKRKDCNKYRESSLRAIRWLIQNTYSKDNTQSLPNPKMAIGGLYWSRENREIRTDSVAHALNAYLRLVNDLPDNESLISLPRKKVNQRFY
jgi:hypothetical protein